jgi:hypothetical protein
MLTFFVQGLAKIKNLMFEAPFPNPSPKGEGSLPVFQNLAERYNYNEMIFYNDSFICKLQRSDTITEGYNCELIIAP